MTLCTSAAYLQDDAIDHAQDDGGFFAASVQQDGAFSSAGQQQDAAHLLQNPQQQSQGSSDPAAASPAPVLPRGNDGGLADAWHPGAGMVLVANLLCTLVGVS